MKRNRKKYNVTEDLEMKMDDVMDVTEEMMAYLRETGRIWLFGQL